MTKHPITHCAFDIYGMPVHIDPSLPPTSFAIVPHGRDLRDPETVRVVNVHGGRKYGKTEALRQRTR